MAVDLTTRNLLISLCSHMSYMQGQLEALHQLDDPDDHYWFRESVALRQKAADHLAALADEPAEPEPATWTEGVCGDGAALLKDGVMVPIETVVRELNDGARAVLARRSNPAPQPAAVTGRPSDEELLATLKQALDAFSPRHPEAVAMNVDEYSLALELRKARAVLARWGNPAPQPAAVTEQPSDEELLDLLPQGNESGFWLPKGLPSDWVDGDFIAPPKAIIAFARDVLELWGSPAPPSADREVAELVAELQSMATDADRRCRFSNAERLSRVADLLQRLSPPQPLANGEAGKPVAWMCPAEPYFDGNKWHDQWQVTLDQRLAEYWARPGKPTPLFTRAAELLQREALAPVAVSERLPGPEDCDAEGRCWFGTPGCDVWGASWVLRKRSHQRNGITSWIPAHSLPLPEVGE